jgi:hypothetical protein
MDLSTTQLTRCPPNQPLLRQAFRTRLATLAWLQTGSMASKTLANALSTLRTSWVREPRRGNRIGSLCFLSLLGCEVERAFARCHLSITSR